MCSTVEKNENTMYDLNSYAFPFPFSSRTSFVVETDVNFDNCLVDAEADSIDCFASERYLSRSLCVSADLIQWIISFFSNSN